MYIAIPMLVLMATVSYFAIIGVKTTVEKRQGDHGLTMIRDLFKYLALFIAVVITCFGLAGLLTQIIDNTASSHADKLDAARWLSFVVVGIPIISLLSRWIKRDFTKNLGASEEPAWQIYLLAGSTFSLMVWFVPLTNTLKWFAGGAYHPRSLAQEIIAFAVWLIHLKLLKFHKDLISNIHRFIGWFSGAIGLVLSAISIIDWNVSKAIDVLQSPLQVQEAIILAAVSFPVLFYYWQDFEKNATSIEIRFYRTFGGMATPILFYTVAATFAIHQFLSWHFLSWQFEEHFDEYGSHFAEVPQQIGVVAVLIPTMLYFRKLVAGAQRDDVTRIFQYLISAGGTFAIALSIGAITAGLLDETDTDAILFGLSILFVVSYTWYRQWSHCQFAMSIDFEGEHHSPIRRLYLTVAIGIPTLFCIGSGTWLTYRILEALLVGGVEKLRYAQPAGFLVGAGVVALYHLRVMRKERD